MWGHADLARIAPVREDGTLSFPLIGDVRGAGRTLREVEREIQERLNSEYIVNPQVTIRLTGAKFSIFGEVNSPGTYVIEGTMDLLTAMSLAGGITKFGSNSIEIIRGERDKKLSIRANIERIVKGKEPNIEILPRDTIYARRRLF